jgi:exonuclease SbcC
MTLLDSFGRPKWQHKNPDVRIEGIDLLDDPDLLLEIVNADPDPAVQARALSRINNPDTLDKLIDTLPLDLQKQARSQRLLQLLPDDRQLDTIKDDKVLVRIASLTDDTELMTAAISQVKSSEIRIDVASNHPQLNMRLQAALGISDIELLSELMQSVRGHDKAVYRHCKKLVDQHHAEQRAKAERQEKILHLTGKAQELAKAVDSPDYKGRYQQLNQQWQTISEYASSECKEEVQKSLAICADRLDRQFKAQLADELRLTERANAGQEFLTIIGELEQFDTVFSLPGNAAVIAQATKALDHIENRWQVAEIIIYSSPEQKQILEKYLQRWRSMLKTSQNLISRESELSKHLSKAKTPDALDFQALQKRIKRTDKLINSLHWPDSHKTGLPAQIAQLHEVRDQLNTHLNSLHQNQEKHIAHLQTLLKNLHTEFDQDHIKKADRAYSKARRALKPLDQKQRQRFEHELKPMAARLHEAHDWQGFAIEPKKVELCASMQALAGSEENAEILAAKIKSLQAEWKQLGTLSHPREQALWDEFKAASNEAWKPCKVAFEQQAELRKENFSKRMELVAQLKHYEEKMAWPQAVDPGTEDAGSEDTESDTQPDWRMVQKTLDTAREAFRNIKPVDQRGERKSQKAFRSICDRIYGHIKEEYGRNIALKEALVARAQELPKLEDLHQSIDKAKKLQRDWKEIGMTPVGADRKLWKAFRAACDAVFARLDEQRDQNKAEVDAHVKQAESLRDQARALLNSDDDEKRLHLKKELSELKQQFREIELPRNIQQRLGKDFLEIESQARNVVSDIRVRQEQAAWQRLQEKIKACALKATDEKTASQLWQQAAGLPKGIDAEALEAFWQQGPGNIDDEQLREACIALEILGGIDSPEEDKKARMNYQMRQLVEGMGNRKALSEQSLLNSINDFVALRPSNNWAERFCAGVGKTRDQT